MLLYLKNKKPTRCHLLFLFFFLDIQHVSGINPYPANVENMVSSELC